MQAGPSNAQQGSQELIVLAGVVGSGKSTLSQAWQQHLPDWVRVNQDDLGDRRTCEAAVRTALAQGKNVVVDRQNFDAGQRRTWLEIANEYPHVRVGGMVMGTPKEECRVRLLTRTNHPTIDNPELAVSLLEKFSGLWEEPRLEEGFDQLVTLPPLPPAAEIDATLIRSLLDLLHQSPRNPHAASQRTPRPRPAPYMRPDGFVDDGTWRPPVPRQDRAPAPSPYYGSAYRAPPPQAPQSMWSRGPPPAAYGTYHNPYPYQPPSGPPAWPNQPPYRSGPPREWRNETGAGANHNPTRSAPHYGYPAPQRAPYDSRRAFEPSPQSGPPPGAGPPPPQPASIPHSVQPSAAPEHHYRQ
ncbi:hypothetical protein JCM8115_001488 [Rhodotorula mucilaginosa]